MNTKNLFIYTLLLFAMLSCEQKIKIKETAKTTFLNAIDGYRDLSLVLTDDRLGEWGGNSFVIKIYKDKNGKILLSDYREYEGTMIPPPPPEVGDYDFWRRPWYSNYKVVDSTLRIIVSEKEAQLVENAIYELLANKLKYPEHVPGSGGNWNYVFFNDKTIEIDDYESNNWKYYKLLKKSLLKE